MHIKRLSFHLGLFLALFLSVGIFFAHPVFAQSVDLESFAQAAGFSTNASITVIIARLIRTAISLVGVIAVVFMIYGGFVWMTAGGNEDRVKSAKRIMMNAMVGLLLVFSAFAIVQFILGALVGATNATSISTSTPSAYFSSDNTRTNIFYLSSVNTECAEALQNLQLQFVFSKNVRSSEVLSGGGILIRDEAGQVVDGTFIPSGRSVTFTPAQVCDSPNETEHCFDASSKYSIDVDPSVLRSATGSTLVCSSTHPCSFVFTTGTGVDLVDPTIVMDAPEDGESIFAGAIELLQANTADDSGVSTVDFYVIDNSEAVYSSGVDFSSAGALLGGNENNSFFTDVLDEWDTQGYLTNERYPIWARASDCAGNTSLATRVQVVLRAPSCENNVQDTDLGETDIDCGGDRLSRYYCGSCEGDECSVDADCASAQCIDGQCVVVPKIERVSSGNGAPGNFVTISGEGFGGVPGVVTFLGSDRDSAIQLEAYQCGPGVQWTDNQIIVQVPREATDGPIGITTGAQGEPKQDLTDDDYGPLIADFDVNSIVRPGICSLSPNTDDQGSPVTVSGNNFGASQGTSLFYFSNYESSSYTAWGEESLGVVVPNVNARRYQTQVFTGDYVCVDADNQSTNTVCSTDADCDADNDERCATKWCSQSLDYCATNADCADGAGICDSIRVGSNQVDFSVIDASSAVNPVIVSVDSGWKACSDTGLHCGVNADCGLTATCEDVGNWGPAGQYVTIYGTGFGSAIGSVSFENEALGYTALGDAEFPLVCGDDFWHDTYITVKVPEIYQTEDEDRIEYIEHALVVESANGRPSNAESFIVLNDTPGPAICSVNPTAGPVGTSLTINGENFGDTNGVVRFYSLQNANYTTWSSTQISRALVPNLAQTGPISVVESQRSYTSNSVNFRVGDCREDSGLCTDGELCCANGSCSVSCDLNAPVSAHYAFKISTGLTPSTPQVVVACSESGSSPAPWEGWSAPEDVCVNASVEAEFNMPMEQASINTSTVIVEKCTAFYTQQDQADGLGDEGTCKTWEAVLPNQDQFSTDDTGFSWSPEGVFEASTQYRATLLGEDAIQSLAGGFLAEDYSWLFTTSSNTDLCEVGDVNVRPANATKTQRTDIIQEEETDVDYSAQLIAKNDRCVSLSCVGYSVGWDTDDDYAVLFPQATPPLGVCTNDAWVMNETPAQDPAGITATVLNTVHTPADTGNLTINFVDPQIETYFPQCTTACVNALPSGTFNTQMNASTINAQSVSLHVCQNSLCELAPVSNVGFGYTIAFSEITNSFSIVFAESAVMQANTWYRVVVQGDLVESASGVRLSKSGSNYGSDENRYYPDDFSWVFRTKDDSVSCAIDSVKLTPELARMSYVGQRNEFEATTYGEPDECSLQGQPLQIASSVWEPWVATDTPDSLLPASGSYTAQENITAYMVAGGSIELSSTIPSFCTAVCLNAGAPVTTAQGVCGNGEIELSEECDDANTTNLDGCSSRCLNEGSLTCGFACVLTNAVCTSDTACRESCVSAVCSGATDIGQACTINADCDSGICSETNQCADYADAGEACTNNTSCDGSCVGRCSLSNAVCSGPNTDCPAYTGDTCELSGSGCCGDGVLNLGEDCDDSNILNGDGCSAVCRDEGAQAIGSSCGDGVRDWNVITGGEDCDDGNTLNGDGCSNNCLLEGSLSSENVFAICGNGTACTDSGDCDENQTCNADGQCVEVGEDCDPGNPTAEGDGCSSRCLYEGTPACPSDTSTNCCGNGVKETGEACDGEEGCSGSCRWSGSSYAYTIPSFCGDGSLATGETCDALTSENFTVGRYGVSQIATGAPVEVDEVTGYAISIVSATVDQDVTGEATIELQCACTTDLSCGGTGLGCGAGNCCYERPEIVDGQVSPSDNIEVKDSNEDGIPDAVTILGEGYCRNTAVWIEFTQPMDKTTFDQSEDTNNDGVIDQDEFAGNVYLDLVSVANVSGDQEIVEEVTDCPTGYLGAPQAASIGFGNRVWNWVKSLVLAVFGREAEASTIFACHVPVNYQVTLNQDGSSHVQLQYSSLLQKNAVYRLVVVGDAVSSDDKQGVIGENKATLCIGDACQAQEFIQYFGIGSRVCSLDRILMEDQGIIGRDSYEPASARYFSATNEAHAFKATPQTHRSSGYEEISPLPGSYDWSWGWGSSILDGGDADVVAPATELPQDTSRTYTASGVSGKEVVLATATITVDQLFTPSTAQIADNPTTVADETSSARTVSGTLDVTAMVCENPWPALSSPLGFPYLQEDTSNFSFFYCRDAGEDGFADDLPALSDPIVVTSPASSTILRENVFKVAGYNDAIGIRILANPSYLDPSDWVSEQGFTGGFSPTQLDGYLAVQSGTTLYATATNVSGGVIYPNIYVVSYNENAGAPAKEIFSQILNNWRFNANTDVVSDVNLCTDREGAYVTKTGQFVECAWDGDCFDVCQDGSCSEALPSNIVCNAQKAKLTRDMQRLIDVTTMSSTINTSGEINGHCSITKGQSCQNTNECPGSESCISGYPTVQSGSFIPALSNSLWTSWNATLANEVGLALPKDPINEFYNCSGDGYDTASCWNGEAGTFMCPTNSHLYGYQGIGGEDYILYTQLETSGNAIWNNPVDIDANDTVTIVAEYPTGNAPSGSVPSGFERVPVFCDGASWGDSGICGDGTQGIGEFCEIGDITSGGICGVGDEFQACTTNADCPDTLTCYTSSCSVCVNPTNADFDGVACTSPADDCGDGGTCSLGSTYYACANITNECVWDVESPASCIAFQCGNGVVEAAAGEECDDGTLNGTYGHCSNSCTVLGSFACGDGYLAGNEQCDCGTVANFSSLLSPSSSSPSPSWAQLNACVVSNGQYASNIATSCAYNCTTPGPSCGDGRINGSEQCDGGYEESIKALCTNGITECTSNADCVSGETCGDASHQAPGTGRICVGGSNAGGICTADTQCPESTCSTNTYPLYRYRSCVSSCSWGSWTGPVGGNQICGNGTLEGNEVCDDGNTSNNDSCTNACQPNVCGDDYVYVGVESCDSGDDNSDLCSAPYGGTCNYCNATCQYRTQSGGYCGDQAVNGPEICDGSFSTQYRYFDAPTDTATGTCLNEGEVNPTNTAQTCRWLGVCDGGTENGALCTLNAGTYSPPGTPAVLSVGVDTNTCGGGGRCVPPICADNCGSSCPTSFLTTGLLVQSALANSVPQDSVDLFSYANPNGDAPTSAVVFVPACNVATKITADVDNTNVIAPTVDIVFVTDLSGSMDNTIPSTTQTRIGLVVDATQSAVQDLFDAYPSNLRIGLVSFQAISAGFSRDQELQDSSGQSSILTTLAGYPVLTDNGTPTYLGLNEAISMLSSSSADVKIVVLLSDGAPSRTNTMSFCDQDSVTFLYTSTLHPNNDYMGVNACVAQAADLVGGHSNIIFYTATISSSSSEKGYMAHLSSNTCEWGIKDNISEQSDCVGNYAFTGTTEDQIEEMYQSIVDSIIGANVTFTTVDADNTAVTTTGQVQPGNNKVLPFPNGFSCKSTQQNLPLVNNFYGSGSMGYSEFTMTYCPYDAFPPSMIAQPAP